MAANRPRASRSGLVRVLRTVEVWRWNGTSWTKIGGDSLNGGWTNYVERVASIAIHNAIFMRSVAVLATGRSGNGTEQAD